MVKTEVEKFEDFRIKDGEFQALSEEVWYPVKDLLREGSGNTIVRYYDDGELITMVQDRGRNYRNDRIYG